MSCSGQREGMIFHTGAQRGRFVREDVSRGGYGERLYPDRTIRAGTKHRKPIDLTAPTISQAGGNPGQRSIKTVVKRAIVIAALLLTACAEYHVSYCRHRAVECALIYGEVYGPDRVGVAIGPTGRGVWHGQAYVLTDKGRRWLVNMGHGCEIGDREPFAPMKYFTLEGFMENQFPEFRSGGVVGSK